MAQWNACPWRTTKAKGQLESCHKDVTSNNVAMMVQVVMVETILIEGRMANNVAMMVQVVMGETILIEGRMANEKNKSM